MKKRIIGLLAALAIVLPVTLISASALTPTYTVTDAYKSSKFYDRLCAVELTGDQRRDILNVAISQLGYHEGNSKDDFNGYNWSGSNNYVEYNYGNRNTYSNNGTYSYAWCASFVTWCARQAQIPTSTIINSVSCDKFVQSFSSVSRYHTRDSGYEPTPGDLIFYLSANADRQSASHIGIVVGTDEKDVYAIEGNTGRGLVNLRSYEKSNTYIVGYAEPAYTGTTGDYSGYPLLSGYIEEGYYTVTASSLNMRASSSTSSNVVCSIPNGTELYITEANGDWGKTTYGGKSGWVYLTYVQPKDNIYCTISFDANGSDAEIAPISVRQGSVAVISSDTPRWTGKTFLGWSTVSDAQTAEYIPGSKITLEEDMTLYAVWTTRKITVEFYDYDGTLIDKTVYNYGDKLIEPEHPVRESDGEYDYFFKDWGMWLEEYAVLNRTYVAQYTQTERTDTSTVEESETAVPVMAEPNETEPTSGCGSFATAEYCMLLIVLAVGTVITVRKRI